MQPTNRIAVSQIETDQYTKDPLETIEHGLMDQELSSLRKHIERIDRVLDTDKSLTYDDKMRLYKLGADMRLDWLYAEHGGKQLEFARFEAEAIEAATFFGRAANHAKQKEKTNPIDSWGIHMRALDLTAYRAHRYLKESETTFKGTQDAKILRNFADSKMQQSLSGSVSLMRQMETFAHGEGMLARKTRGTLYELMLTTYSRYGTYDREDYDQVFVRTALTREDAPRNNHTYPKRGFDIVIESAANTTLLQAKNYDNTDEYATPIYKVVDTRFGRTLHDLRDYVADFTILTANSSDPLTRERTEKAGRRLDAVFGTQLHDAIDE